LGEIQEGNHAIGIIGARRTTHYDSESAKKLYNNPAYAGLIVISGLYQEPTPLRIPGVRHAKGLNDAVTTGHAHPPVKP